VVIQGWLSHSLNDRSDWQSGTDQHANEYFSGGSGALRGYLGLTELLIVAIASLLLVAILANGQAPAWTLWLYLAIGLWGAVAYSCRPWRLSYHPYLGEWLAAFPAITACGLASYQVLAKELVFTAAAAAVLHGLLCVCWLMQHHLPDWSRDLQASPPKLTTIATVARRSGLPQARLVIVAYFLVTVVVAGACSLVNSRFIWTALLAALGAILAYRQNVFQKRQVAWRELQMVGLTLINAWVIGWVV
jgi:1,4-dihydroxy-2-naphthoate octaprenyltransferase